VRFAQEAVEHAIEQLEVADDPGANGPRRVKFPRRPAAARFRFVLTEAVTFFAAAGVVFLGETACFLTGCSGLIVLTAALEVPGLRPSST
jgi:hypothetical protein